MTRSASRQRRRPRRAAESGHALLIIVVMITIMIVMSTVAVQVWNTIIRREREDELIYRGKQYAQAIFLFRKARGVLPNDLKLLEEKGPKGEHILRRAYKDPITGKDFGLVYAGPNNVPIPDAQISENQERTTTIGEEPLPTQTPMLTSTTGLGILGVYSRSEEQAIGPSKWRDLERYNQWLFVVTDIAGGAPPGTPVPPNQPGGPGGPGGPGLRGATPGGNRRIGGGDN